MPTFQIVFTVTVAMTAASGLAASAIVIFGDTRRNLGQRVVAERLAQIALVGATAAGQLSRRESPPPHRPAPPTPKPPA